MSEASIDNLQIEINAQAVKANTAIDNLVGKLNTLSSSLGKVNGSNLTGLANGVQRLGTAMQTMNNVRTSDFTRLAKNLNKLGEASKSIGIINTFKFSLLANGINKLGISAQAISGLNTSGLTRIANSITKFSTVDVAGLRRVAAELPSIVASFNGMGTVSANAQQVGLLASNISKLGNKSVQTAVTNIPQLATALRNLMQTLSTAPRVSNNIIQMTNALSNLASQGSRLGTATNSINSGLIRTNSTMISSKKHAFSLASAFGKFYANLFLVIRAIKALWKSIEGTTDYIEAFNYYNVSFEKIASEWSKDFEKYGYENAESYAESFIDRINESFEKMSGIKVEISEDGTGLLTDTGLKNLGLNIQEITQYASQLASVTNSVGQTGEVSLVAAQSFTKLGADISSLFNVDYSSVMSNLQSGLIGQSRALYKYGIDITNATLQTYAYELGLSKAVSEMTQAEKMQLRMIAILDQSKVSWGDLANTINTPSNMIRQLKNNLKEVGTVLGQLFIPLLQKVLPVINGITIALKTLLVNIAGFFGVKLDLDDFSQGYTDLGDSLDDVVDSYDEATDSAKEFKGQLAGFDKLNTISTQSSASDNGSSGLGSSIDLTDEILAASSAYEKVWNETYANMENDAQKFADKIVEVFKTGNFESVGSYISKGIQNALESINWNSVYSGASNFGSGVASFLNGLITPGTFSLIGTTISNALNTVFVSSISFSEEFDFTNLGTSLASAVNGFDFYSVLKNGITATGNFATGLLKALTGAVKGLDFGELIDEVVSGVVDGLENFDYKDLATSWGELLGAAITQLMNIDAKIDEMVTSLIDSIGEYFDEKIDECGGNVALGILKGIADGFVGIGTWIYDNLAKPFLDGFSSEFSQSKFTEKIGSIKDAIKEKWESAKTWWNDHKPSLANISAKVEDFKSKVSNAWSTAKTWWNDHKPTLANISAKVEDFKSKVSNAWSAAKTWWNDHKPSLPDLSLKMKVPHISITYDRNAWNASIFKALGFSGTPKFSVSYYAQGGFPEEDGWFRASHGEIMGKFDNGQSVVANNMQITEGISDAVYRGNQALLKVMQQELAETRKQNETLKQLLAKETGISKSDIFNSVRSSAKEYKNRTGNLAFT